MMTLMMKKKKNEKRSEETSRLEPRKRSAHCTEQERSSFLCNYLSFVCVEPKIGCASLRKSARTRPTRTLPPVFCVVCACVPVPVLAAGVRASVVSVGSGRETRLMSSQAACSTTSSSSTVSPRAFVRRMVRTSYGEDADETTSKRRSTRDER